MNSVKKIYTQSDVHPLFVRLAIQHLLYYGCAKLVDIFQYSNMYNVNANITHFLLDREMQADCKRYISLDMKHSAAVGDICMLYAALKGGVTVSNWMHDHDSILSLVDVRRMMIYGVIKGFIYRMHTYPIMFEDLNLDMAKSVYIDVGIWTENIILTSYVQLLICHS